MTNPTIRIHNTETDEILDREMTEAEVVIYKTEQSIYAKAEEKTQATAAEKQAILDQLGITAEQVKLLLS